MDSLSLEEIGHDPQVGDLIADIEHEDVGLVIDAKSTYQGQPFHCYRILNAFGIVNWFSPEYILGSCRLISAASSDPSEEV
jgi:hypothetical protein